MWIVLVQALLGGLVIAAVGGIAFYYASLLFLTLVSAVLPLRGGRPALLRGWRSKEKSPD